VPGPVLTSQSSKAERSLAPAWPVKVISYVCDRTVDHAPAAHWFWFAASMPGTRVCVSTLSRVHSELRPLPPGLRI
jgi:hypothetical protein